MHNSAVFGVHPECSIKKIGLFSPRFDGQRHAIAPIHRLGAAGVHGHFVVGRGKPRSLAHTGVIYVLLIVEHRTQHQVADEQRAALGDNRVGLSRVPVVGGFYRHLGHGMHCVPASEDSIVLRVGVALDSIEPRLHGRINLFEDRCAVNLLGSHAPDEQRGRLTPVHLVG